MTEETADLFYTAKHKRLLRIASVANIFVWIIVVVFTLLALMKPIHDSNIFLFSYANASVTYWQMLSQNPLYSFSLFVSMLSSFTQGIIYALVLKGVSLGLNMIVEIDLNQKAQVQEVEYE